MELDEKALARVSLFLAVAGLLILYAFQEGYRDASIASLPDDCTGRVSVNGSVRSAFFTKSGSHAVSVSRDVFILLKNGAAFQGDRIIVRGRAQASGASCWIFADSVRVL